MKSAIELNTWNRKEHFEFFNNFDEPFFGIVADIDCTNALSFCRENKFSFFHFYLFQSLRSANQVEAFRYRIEDGKPVVHDVVHASSTISRPDKTFGFSFIPFAESFSEFSEFVKMETTAVAASPGLRLNENTSRNDVIHFSVLPWISFKGLTHARHFRYRDSVPKITFGKYYQSGNKLLMPVSVNAHHGLMDALHVSFFLDKLEQYLKYPSV
jgi:chloramphenicol O-acetyltransferase type A